MYVCIYLCYICMYAYNSSVNTLSKSIYIFPICTKHGNEIDISSYIFISFHSNRVSYQCVLTLFLKTIQSCFCKCGNIVHSAKATHTPLNKRRNILPYIFSLLKINSPPAYDERGESGRGKMMGLGGRRKGEGRNVG